MWQAALDGNVSSGTAVAEDPHPLRGRSTSSSASSSTGRCRRRHEHRLRRDSRPCRRAPAGSTWSASSASSPLGFTVWLGLWITPPDEVQGNLARLLYIHPPIATVALYWAGGVAAAGSLLYLWPRTRSFFWDRLAASAVEVGAVFSALTLVTGSLWGRPAWGTWWTWDARLTSTALLLLLEIGYLALRRVPADPHIRAKRCAVAALLIAIDVPHRPLLGRLVEHPAPGGHVPRPRVPAPRLTAPCPGRSCSASSPSR